MNLWADQATQMLTAILQHHMVLDYLLEEERGVCSKLNYSSCLKFDDNGKVAKQITPRIRKLVHVPIQTWRS